MFLVYGYFIQINLLFHMVLYVQKNEETSHVKIIHFYQAEKGGIPSELEANAKSESIRPHCWKFLSPPSPVLDEAFPEITVDLVRHLMLLYLPKCPTTDLLLHLTALDRRHIRAKNRACFGTSLGHTTFVNVHELSWPRFPVDGG
jgi:hypothetical protein